MAERGPASRRANSAPSPDDAPVTSAGRGHDLVLVARSRRTLDERAARLRRAFGVRVDVVAADLADPCGVASTVAAVRRLGIEVDVLVNNAGFGTHGRFDLIDPAADRAQVGVDVAAVVDLTHAFLPGMVARRRGTVVNVASIGAFLPAPHLAVYGASKAFVLSFSQAVAAEAKPFGVRVVTLCPGPVRTGFFHRLGTEKAAIGQTLPAGVVVAQALRRADRGGGVVVPGLANRLVTVATGLVPRRVTVPLAARLTAGLAVPSRAAGSPS
jgi:short-subunit dehydrogenase